MVETGRQAEGRPGGERQHGLRRGREPSAGTDSRPGEGALTGVGR